MGFVDKLKNIFFEEEEEEEEVEDTRPPKKEKEKEIIAKRVELPRRKKEEEEETDDDILDDKILEIKQEVPKKEVPKKETPKVSDLIFEDEDFILDLPKEEKKEVVKEQVIKQVPREPEVKPSSIKEEVKKAPPIYEYTRQERETRKMFTPSPIISPIYGILDKNYKKEEVKERKEVRIYSRSERMDLDSVRNKAFGDLETELFDNTPISSDTEEEEKESIERPSRDIRKLRENREEKPAIDKVTLGEADEYFNDLGLAYNTDYKDISKDINDGKVPREVKEKDDSLEDNLFDLIESMYDKEE